MGFAQPKQGEGPRGEGRVRILDFLGAIAGWFRPYPGRSALIVFCLLLEMGFASGVPLLFQALIDKAIVPRQWTTLELLLTMLVGGAVLVSVAGIGKDYLYARIVARVLSELRGRLFGQMDRLPADYFARHSVADVSARFSNDLASVEAGLTSVVPWLVLPGLDVLVGTLLLFTLDWRLAIIAQLVWPMSLLGPRVFAPRASRAALDLKAGQDHLLYAVDEAARGQPVIKAFGLSEFVAGRFRKTAGELGARGIRMHFLLALVERSSGIGIKLMQAIVLGAGGYLAFNDRLSIGSLVAFQALFTSVSLSIGYVTQYFPTLVQSTVGFQRINEFLKEPVATADTDRGPPLAPFRRDIACEHVSFALAGKTILQDISLVIRRGESVAFVGPSGSGKSTLLTILLRFNAPTAGTIQFDGVDVASVPRWSLARQQAVVFQDSFLFNTSIRENIRLGRLDATDDEIEAAARAAELHELVIRLPQGYDTSVGEHGSNLSNGQRQRVAIARALVRNPAILVLDEATSALDVATESAINRTLEQLRAGRTVVAVTHRLAAITSCDRIFVLSDGRLVEDGRHEELLALDGTYARLWQKQSGFVVNESGDRAEVTAERLRAVPLLRSLDLPSLSRLADRFATERLAANRIVVQQGDLGDRFYIVVRGSVGISVATAEGERQLAVLEDGDHFGEIALLHDTPRIASARTLKPTVLISLSRKDFLSLVGETPELLALVNEEADRRMKSQVA